jgi:hypothetical protein
LLPTGIDALRPGASVLLAACAVLVSGCGGERRPALHPVHGTVTLQGRPAEQAVVVLRPAIPGARPNPPSHGTVGPDGTFRLGTFAEADGVPVGEYLVTITWPLDKTDAAGDVLTIDRLKGRFAEPARSKWRVTIREGDNELEPFRLD